MTEPKAAQRKVQELKERTDALLCELNTQIKVSSMTPQNKGYRLITITGKEYLDHGVTG